MPTECAEQIAVTPIEASDDIIHRREYLVLAEGQDAHQHRTGAGVLPLETLLPGDKQSRDDSGPVGREPLWATGDQASAHGSHCSTADKRCACCRVEITARVDS